MLREFLREGTSSRSKRIDRIVDCDLAVLMVEKMVDVVSTFLEDLLTKKYRSCRS